MEIVSLLIQAIGGAIGGNVVGQLSRALSTGSTVAIGLQIADALTALHEAGHVHGDVRPGHVFLADRGAVLLGFGQGARPTARPGQTAPEIASGGPAGAASDVYGLGVTLHYALTGRLPFQRGSPWAVLGAQRGGPPEAPPGPAGDSDGAALPDAARS